MLPKSDKPVSSNTEEQLRAEVERLTRLLNEQKRGQSREAGAPHAVRPSGKVIAGLIVLSLLILGGAFALGYIPRTRRQLELVAEAGAQKEALPEVSVAAAVRAPASGTLVLPGNIQPVTEAPILARAEGYVKTRYVDIGDRVTAGQLLAEIEAPDLDQQVRQAQAAVQQVQADLERSNAALQQGKANESLAKVTAERWANLARRGVVSRQENDQYQAQYQAQSANVQALDHAVTAAKANLAASKANVARLAELQSYLKVRAPFAGVITQRNVDVGALVNNGSTLLFRIAQTKLLRTYLNVPQSSAADVHVGQVALLSTTDSPDRKLRGTVARTANALDPATRTLLTEVQVSNPDGKLLPGMYVQVDLNLPRKDPPLLIPSDTLVLRPEGTLVALLDSNDVVHFQRVTVGRDLGDRIEVLAGLEEHQRVIVNPNDAVQEGVKVRPASAGAPRH